MSDPKNIPGLPTARQNAMMAGVDWYDPTSLASHLLAAADFKIEKATDGSATSISIAFEPMIGASTTWSQALRGLQAMGFEGVTEVTSIGSNYAANPVFTFDQNVFSFGKDDSMRMSNHVKPPREFTIRGAHNIEIAQQWLSVEHQVEKLAAAGRTAG